MLTTGLATVVVLLLLAMLLWIVAVNALGWFWPARLWQVQVSDGSVVVGERLERRHMPAHGGSETDDVRVRFKVGNREVSGRDHVWVRESDIVRQDRPTGLVRITRREYGVAIGWLESVTDLNGARVGPTDDGAVQGVLAEAAQVRDALDEKREAVAQLRRPLARMEQQLSVLKRSSHAGTPNGQREVAELEQRIEEMSTKLRPQLEALASDRARFTGRLNRAKLVVVAGDLRVAVPLAGVIEVEWPNRSGLGARIAKTLGNGFRFLVLEPREANTEGGIYPALFGTVLMVLLMSLAVMPLGVLTAVYMTEYATDGPLMRLADRAVNNLAGVPSIVIGMFGLAFFVYGIGGAVDQVLFDDRLPTPTFGTGGILWASLTLALLTVPVVVVATREGLMTVPRGWREGALALGATQWQTLRRIVIPAAMPGILTGLILAVSRAAGEVAPLMLTGAVKLTHAMPLDGTPPFLHLQRKFMHLGFHIYDVSMQSPNVEAAKPMAFASTLVLLALVVLINLTAIVIRRRLRQAYRVVEM
jgi:phosphate transport system permease protein